MRRDLQRDVQRVWERLRCVLAREAAAFQRRVVQTERRESLVAVLILALIIGLVTWASNASGGLNFLLFPPLAAATYQQFAYPEEPPHLPWTFPLALTAGAVSGWVAQAVARAYFAPVPQGPFQVDPTTAALTVLLAGGFMWLFDTERSPAMAVGLLLPFAGVPPAVYTGNVFLASTLVAVVFSVWRQFLR